MKTTAVKVGGLNYRISEEAFTSSSYVGELNGDTLQITIKDSLTSQIKGITLLHEIFHAILQQSGHGKFHEEEGLIDALAFGLAQVMRDNPAMVKEIIKC